MLAGTESWAGRQATQAPLSLLFQVQPPHKFFNWQTPFSSAYF